MRTALLVVFLSGCVGAKPEKPLDACQQWAQDVKRVCAHQGRDCGATVCPADGMVWFRAEAK